MDQELPSIAGLEQKFSDERDRRYTEQFAAQEKMITAGFAAQAIAITTAFAAQEKSIATAFTTQEKATAAALSAAKEAVSKAEVSNEKRFEEVKEGMSQIRDQATMFVARDEYLMQQKSLNDKMDAISNIITKSLADTATANTERFAKIEGTQSKMVGGLVLFMASLPVLMYFLEKH
jgi:hypothetical protein